MERADVRVTASGFRAKSGWHDYRLFVVVLLSGLILAPRFVSDYYVSFLFALFISITLAETYDLVGGYMGYMNLGHGAFFGIGAYAYGIVLTHGGNSAVGLAVAAIAPAAFAAAIGLPIFRLRGTYFAIATFGVLVLLEVVTANLQGITGGTTGLSIQPASHSTIITYYLLLLVCVASVSLSAIMAYSRFGLGLLTIREDEDVANASGVNTESLKRQVLVVSALLPGLAGALYMWQTTYIDPDSAFGPTGALLPVIMALLGGSGTILGPIVGAIFLATVQQLLWSYVGHLQLTVYGIALVAVGVLMPEGLMRSRLFRWIYVSLRIPDQQGYHPSTAVSRSQSRSQG